MLIPPSGYLVETSLAYMFRRCRTIRCRWTSAPSCSSRSTLWTSVRVADDATPWKLGIDPMESVPIGPPQAAALSQLQSRASKPDMRLAKDANNLIADVKMNDPPIKIHTRGGKLKWDEWPLLGGAMRPKETRSMADRRFFYELLMADAWVDLSLVGWATGRSKHVARSSLSAEIQ